MEDLPNHADKYTWSLLYDMNSKGIFWYKMNMAVGLTEHISNYLSKTGQYNVQPLGKYRDCSGITLYHRRGSQMVLIAKDGRVSGEHFYDLDAHKESSYVVQAYLSPNQYNLWYRENKQRLYLTVSEAEYVLCLHFELEEQCDTMQIERYKEEYLNGILEGKQEFLEFVTLVLGGVKND